MQTFHKLVRDKIPEIIAAHGDTSVTHIADEAEFRTKLYEKLAEEVAEITENPTVEEAADILEVLQTICALEGWDFAHLEKERVAKAEKRGGFHKRIILETTE